MIYDKIENIELYKSVHPRFAKAIEWLKSIDPKTIETGRVLIDGDNLFANVDEYTTAPLYKKAYEGHHKYIDIQVLVSGEEMVEHAIKTGEEEETIPYDAVKERYKVQTQKDSEFILKENYFAIFFPQDLHKPCINCGQKASKIRKIVFKVKMD